MSICGERILFIMEKFGVNHSCFLKIENEKLKNGSLQKSRLSFFYIFKSLGEKFYPGGFLFAKKIIKIL